MTWAGAALKSGAPGGTIGRAMSCLDAPCAKPGVSKAAAPVKVVPKAAQSLPASVKAGQPVRPQAPAAPGRLYQELSVVVDLPQSALATVRVYDKGNIEIRLLFAGILPQGQKTFTWDGKSEEGLVTPPGVYTIEVKSGETVQRQEVHVEADLPR